VDEMQGVQVKLKLPENMCHT